LLDLARLQTTWPVERDRQTDPGDEDDRGERTDLLSGHASRRAPIGGSGWRRIGNAIEPPHRRSDRRVTRCGARRRRTGEQAGEIAVVGHSTPSNDEPAMAGAVGARKAGNGHRSIYNGNLCPV
jgi:hypothetical protein